jgi:hypothetical protein
MTWVWNESKSKKNARLLLLAIADCAADDGTNAYPSNAELQRKTGLSERAVQSTLGDLVSLGELAIYRNAGPGGCNRYRVVMTPAESAPPQDLHPAGSAPPANSAGADSAPLPQDLHPTPAEPAPVTVLEPSKNKISSSKRSTTGARGTRLPENFEVTEEMREWVREKCPDVRLPEHDRFCDHFRAASGQRGVKLDWVATWRNWMRTAQERIEERRPRTNGGKPGTDVALRDAPKPSTAVARAAAGLEIANRLRQQREEAERDTR